MQRSFFPLYLALSLTLAVSSACNSTPSATEAKANEVADIDKDPEAARQNKSHAQPTPAGERPKEAFPFVEIAGGRSLRLAAYEMDFQLTHKKPLFPLTNDQVKWIKQGEADERTGNFITYVYEGHEIGLSEPYISVQYFVRNHEDCPDCKTIKSVYHMVEGAVASAKGATVSPMLEVRTGSGKIAYCKDIYCPPVQLQDGQKAAKYLSYAYIEYSEKWMIGFALTTTGKGDFERSKNAFYDLVATFED